LRKSKSGTNLTLVIIVPGSTYWNFGTGTEKGDVEKDTEALENMKDLGETIAWLVKRITRVNPLCPANPGKHDYVRTTEGF